MTDRYNHYESIVDCVDQAIFRIAQLDKRYCFDAVYLENEFIPQLGLNDESLR